MPGHRYYIDEYLMMIRDAFETPAKKMEKRISRLANFLSLGPEDDDPAETIEVTVAMPAPRPRPPGWRSPWRWSMPSPRQSSG